MTKHATPQFPFSLYRKFVGKMLPFNKCYVLRSAWVHTQKRVDHTGHLHSQRRCAALCLVCLRPDAGIDHVLPQCLADQREPWQPWFNSKPPNLRARSVAFCLSGHLTDPDEGTRDSSTGLSRALPQLPHVATPRSLHQRVLRNSEGEESLFSGDFGLDKDGL